MNFETQTTLVPDTQEVQAKNNHFLDKGLECLAPVRRRIDELRGVLTSLDGIGDDDTDRAVAKLAAQLGSLEATVTMIGQVKAGKTSLVNAMIGRPGLLPADINPWTSVVTSLHMTPDAKARTNRASFRFFGQGEWERLMERGGRVGELASRAGAADELEKVRRQIAEMREKSRQRLGRKFELLLGETHDYGYFGSELIERYVCLGDDFEDDIDLGSQQGRFADITKSADVYMHRPQLPIALCIRDTPGVNDTFMMREQITIRAIRESRISVVVLSAHQALSSVDMALIRLISNVKSREVIIFVNRIDELSDPTTQVPEIRDSIRKTLKAHHGPEDAEIIFGSAEWATCALQGGLNAMSEASSAALVKWAERELSADDDSEGVEETVWRLSGIPALFAAIARRIEEGEVHEVVNKTARRAINLAETVRAQSQIVQSDGRIECRLSPAELDERLAQIAQATMQAFEDAQTSLVAEYEKRLERSHRSFLDRATAALVTHLETHGDEAVWSYDPTGLRILLRSAYQVFGRNMQAATRQALQNTASQVTGLVAEATGIDIEDVNIQVPNPVRIAPPVILGQTIALDLKGNWWSRWWQRKRGYRAYAMEFAEMIASETAPIVTDLKGDMVSAATQDARALLREFLQDQKANLKSLATPVRQNHASDDATGNRREILDQSLAALTAYAA